MSGPTTAERVIPLEGLNELVDALRVRGYRVVGPTLRDGAIVYDELDRPTSFRRAGPRSTTPARTASSRATTRRLRIHRRAALVEAVPAPAACAAVARSRNGEVTDVEEEPPPDKPFAFLGVRSCDLAAIGIQDRVLTGGRYVDRDYAARREGIFVVAVDCAEPGRLCFCDSMGTGPRAGGLRPRADRAARRRAPCFLVRDRQRARRRGDRERSRTRDADAAERDAADALGRERTASMGRTLDTDGLKEDILQNLEHPRWDEVADRCLACGNCTLGLPDLLLRRRRGHRRPDR